jgi:hypothetical protein
LRENPTRPKRDGNIDVKRKTGLDADHRDEADGDRHQHVKTEDPVRQGRSLDDPVDGDEKRQHSVARASVTA